MLTTPTKDTTSAAWCFTVNNYDEKSIAAWKAVKSRYVVFGKEVGEEGTPHLQGYICFKNKVAFGAVKRIDARANLRAAHGDSLSNYVYCTKEDEDFYEAGLRPMDQAAKGRAGAEVAREIIELAESGDMETIREEHPEVYLYRQQALTTCFLNQKRELETIQGDLPHLWIWGAPGTGKSRFVRHRYPDFYLKNCETKWWCGYKYEPVVHIEDVGIDFAKFGTYCKLWADRYPFRAEIKGGSMLIRPRLVIVTSNYSPTRVFNDEATLAAVMRRFIVIDVAKGRYDEEERLCFLPGLPDPAEHPDEPPPPKKQLLLDPKSAFRY